MLGFPSQTKTPRSAGLRLELLEDRTTPTVFANGDVYSVAAGQVLTVPAPQGLLANDFSDNPAGSLLRAGSKTAAVYVPGPGSPTLLPPLPTPNLFINPDGSFTFIAPQASQIPTGVSQVTFTYLATNATNPTDPAGIGTVTINLLSTVPHLIAVGADAGGGPHVRVFEAGTSVERFSFFPYESTFTGGVRVAVGDVTGDGIDDIVVIPAEGGGPRLQVYDGRDGNKIVDQFVFDPAFRGGGYVAVGDFNGDGIKDVIVGAGTGGGPRVQVFTLAQVIGTPAFPGQKNGSPTTTNLAGPIADFFAFDPSNSSGVRVAAGALQGNGRDQIVAALGPGGSPLVREFDFQTIGRAAGIAARSSLDFLASDPGDQSGVWVATGKVRGNGQFDIITGSGSGSGLVQVFDGRNGGLLRQIQVPTNNQVTGTQVGTVGGTTPTTPQQGVLLSGQAPGSLAPGGSSIPALASGFSIGGGVRVAAGDWNGDGIDDIITGSGAGVSPIVRVFNSLTDSEITEIFPFPGNFFGGVNVGATP